MGTNSPESAILLGSWTVTEATARQYLAAVGDSQQAYFEHRLIPPLALSALALGALLDKLALAPGAIHSLQEIATVRSVGFGDRITGVAQLERPRRRGGLDFITASYILTNATGAPVQTGKATVLAPVWGVAKLETL